MRPHCIETISTLEWMLNLTGLWPRSGPTTKSQLAKIFVNYFTSCSLMVIILLEAMKQTYNFQVINELTCTALPYAVYILKLRSVTFKRKQFLNVLFDMNSIIFNENFKTHKNEIKVAINTSLVLAKLFKGLVFMVIIFFAIFPLFDEKTLPIPFSYDIGKYRILMHIYQLFALSLAGWNISCIDVLFAILMIVAACQIDVLRIKLSLCVAEVEAEIRSGLYKKEEFDKMVIWKLRRCIQLHLDIISFITKLEDMFSLQAFFQYTTGMVIICSTLFQLIYMVDFKSFQFILTIIFISGVVTQFIMYHWFGNEVLHKSTLINTSCYECEWYKCKPQFRKMMFILMERAKRPLGITALNFTYVSIDSLVSIFKWSYSLFALLRTKYNP